MDDWNCFHAVSSSAQRLLDTDFASVTSQASIWTTAILLLSLVFAWKVAGLCYRKSHSPTAISSSSSALPSDTTLSPALSISSSYSANASSSRLALPKGTAPSRSRFQSMLKWNPMKAIRKRTHSKTQRKQEQRAAKQSKAEDELAGLSGYRKSQDRLYWWDRQGRPYSPPPILEEKGDPTAEQQLILANEWQQALKPTLARWPGSIFTRLAEDNHPRTALQFLKARNWSVPNATQQFVAAMQLREKHAVDSIIDRKDLLSVSEFNHYLPMGFHGHSKRGDMIFIQLPGLATLDGLEKEVGLDAFMNYHRQLLEFEHRKIYGHNSALHGRRIDTTLNIYDCSGLGWHHLRLIKGVGRKIIQMMSSEVQLQYPETLHKCFIINAPAVFEKGFHFIANFWEEAVHRKITITSTDGKELLLNDITADQLPRFLGGSCQCTGCKASHEQGLTGPAAKVMQMSASSYMSMFQAYKDAPTSRQWNRAIYGNEEGRWAPT
eukprot:gb/GEZN01007243.1/.p1 GENE.gb/GEZN01007243.1/~~gb/GEZN01007243.1/.p1  ORF type:complete len:509 (-),score=73.98 gb/GEZN01007243.1/:35-1513(-)